MKPDEKRVIEFEAFKKAWEDYPSQDNEGYVPDRGGFKCGWFAALRWRDEQLGESVYIGLTSTGVYAGPTRDKNELLEQGWDESDIRVYREIKEHE